MKSKTATRFRIWATERLKTYLVDGAAIYNKRLLQSGKVVEILKRSDEELVGGFAGQEIYSSAEEKAANLLYLIIKDHPLVDGNKRSAAALFVTFLSRIGMLEGADISTSALAAITLMVAMSEPREKDMMISLVINMLTPGAQVS